MTDIEKGILNRSERLLGADMMGVIATKKVIIFGVGGVGSWCAESLVRNGIRKLTIVDCDRVCISNCNRQLMATTKTIGQVKVEAMRERLLDINPNAEIKAIEMIYDNDSAESFNLEQYDYAIDAIDSLKDKGHLIMHATSIPTLTLFSSMGAALRIDPTKVTTAEFWKVRNDTLGAALRKKLRQKKLKPAKKFICVYSNELPMENRGTLHPSDTTGDVCTKANAQNGSNDCTPTGCSSPDGRGMNDNERRIVKAQINGSLSHVTGIFGLTLAGLVMSDIIKNA